jgi:hypothetical protein
VLRRAENSTGRDACSTLAPRLWIEVAFESRRLPTRPHADTASFVVAATPRCASVVHLPPRVLRGKTKYFRKSGCVVSKDRYSLRPDLIRLDGSEARGERNLIKFPLTAIDEQVYVKFAGDTGDTNRKVGRFLRVWDFKLAQFCPG